MSTTPNSMAAARARVEQLVERFRTNLDSYKNAAYNETQTRREFIDPFFKALGWDVDNEAGYAPAYKDVIHEDAIKVGGFTKAPDYCFRIGGQRKFFVEAKKPSVDMKNDPEPYYQLRRYGFSAKLPLSIVTDFEELAIVDCRVKPSPNDKASTGRIRYWRYDEYLKHFDEIYNTFSKEAVLTGGFDRSVAAAKTKRGTGEVDKEFLKEIESWRDLLARNIARRNPGLTQRQLNQAVQVTIDRIIFLRICEDRGIEEYGELQGLQNGANVYARLCELFQRADERYNSGLFHFKEEKNRQGHPDDLTLNLKIDDRTLKQILKGLYYPDSPYEFSVLPADILGQVYEQFLGKVIRLTAGHQAKVEDKPEVKKAGGVYYTPTYIVDYIVKNTVGKLLGCPPEAPCPPDSPCHSEPPCQTDPSCHSERSEESALPKRTTSPKPLTPKQAEKLRILDPACGSGSFLIGAYEYLLDWHHDWYSQNDPEKWAKGSEPRLFQGKAGWQLTTAEKKRILVNNIHGVDIDPQAVEVTKLSLLLKVLEEENQESINAQLKFFRERALPDLSRNIKCGNSLIGTDFYEGQQMGLLDEEEQMRINVFDWDGPDGFPEIMKGGGFDAVIGNPPYVRIQAMKEWAAPEVEAYKKLYKAANQGSFDIYVVFIERGLQLLSDGGRLGFICPHKFFNMKYGTPIRSIIANGKHLALVVHFGDQQVFEGATTYTCLIFLDKSSVKECHFIKIDDLTTWRANSEGAEGKIDAKQITAAEWNFTVGRGTALFEKLARMPVKLGDVTNRIYQGPITSADPVFLFKAFQPGKKGTIEVEPSKAGLKILLESAILKRVVRSGSVGRYFATPTALVLFPYEVEDREAQLFTQRELQTRFPLAWEYLEQNRDLLAGREKGKFKDTQWYRFGRTQNLGLWEQPKLMIPYMVTNLAAYLDRSDNFYFINVTTGGYGITSDEKNGSLEYLCALLNSRLLDFYFKRITTTFRSGYFAANKQFIELLPIHPINFSDPTDKSRHDQLVELVERMLDLNKRLQAARTAHEKDTLQRQIDSTDRQIDRLVYELYDLTDEEIKIVESQ
ncbi:MAG: Eco57I restriction-modification methylase domain-containing protein [Thermoleophilia bacterium]